ncbi:MAG: gliding motility-associated C-terminal domain-containing protein, partial [Bacteroidales bacterium]|nr:gliding motility-associated C-terminal domain-containing protein [Bacteroidales bacterium]
SLTIANTEEGDEADYRAQVTGDCGDQTSDEVTLTVNPSTQITTQPSDQTVCEGNDAIFSVSAEGNNLTYQWQSDAGGSWQDLSDGGDISGATTSQLTIANAANADEANYRVMVSSDCGADQTSNAVSLTVNDATQITTQPSDQTVCEGTDATFTSSADGTNLTYQWQSNAGGSWQDLSDGGDISGATTNSLTIANTEESDEADYRVVVSGDCGTETSNGASLTVDPATSVTGQPADQQVCEQEEVIFGIQAEGSGSLTYQWQSDQEGTWQNLADGGDISGSSTDTLTLAQVDTTDEADYRVIVNGACGADTSLPATLDVNWFEINIGQPSPFSVDTNTTKITVSIEVANHEWVQDLGYFLVSPSGEKIRLGSPSGSCFINQQATNLTFTTSQTDTFDVCSDNLSGTYGISGFLSSAHGADPANGAWKIRVEDSQNWTSNTYEGEIISASITFIDQHDVLGDTTSVSYEASDINIPIREYSGLSGAPPAFTEYKVPTGLKTSCFGTCDAIAVVMEQGGMAPYSYEWSDSSNFNNIISTEDTTSLCAGTYYVRVSDGLGCTEIDSVEVKEPDEIVIDSLEVLSIVDKNGCYGSSIGEVHDSAYGGTGTLQYTLLRDPFGEIDTIGVNTSGDFTGLPGGEYFLEVRDDNNCVSDTVFTLAEPDSLEIISEQFTPLSADGAADGSIDVDAQGGTPPLSYMLYLIQPSDTLAVDTTSSGEFTGLTEGDYFVRVTDINDCGPVESSDFHITPLEIDFAVDPVTCADDSNGRVIADIQGGLPPLRYEWTSMAGDTLRVAEKSLLADTLTGLAGGRYILNLIDSTGNNERDTAMVTEPDPLRIVSIVPDTLSGAAASDASITVEAAGGNDTIVFDMVNLNVPSFSATDTSLSVNDTAAVQFSGLEAGLYEITVYDEKGCGYDLDTTHVIHFELSVSKEDILCHGDNNGLVVAEVSGGTLPLEYDWGTTVSSNNKRSDSLANRQPGWYYVTVTDGNGFALNDSIEIIEPSAIHAPAVTQQALCPSDHMPLQGGDVGSIRLDATGGEPYNNPDAAYHYYWQELGDTIPGRDTLTGIGGSDYQVSIIDSNGCSLDTTITLSQVPQNVIDVQYGGVVDSICYGASVSIFVSNLQNADSLYWEDMGDQYLTAQQLDTLRQVQEEDRTYTLRAKNDACILVDSIEVALYPRLNLAIDEGDEISDNQISVKENVSVRQLTAAVQNTSVQATYQWTPERFFNPADQLQTELSVENMRQEELARQRISIVGETRHCTELDTAVVQLIPNVEPSNAFSPNGDGINDEWFIRYASQYEDIEVAVFNRWGVEVYRQKPYRNDDGWDGRTSQGKELPSGTYYYIINTHESGIAPLSGTITIIR